MAKKKNYAKGEDPSFRAGHIKKSANELDAEILDKDLERIRKNNAAAKQRAEKNLQDMKANDQKVMETEARQNEEAEEMRKKLFRR